MARVMFAVDSRFSKSAKKGLVRSEVNPAATDCAADSARSSSVAPPTLSKTRTLSRHLPPSSW
jgi:hypothetical protein